VVNMNDAKPVSCEERRLTTLTSGDSANWLRAMLFANAYLRMPVITLRRGVFDRIGRFDERLRFAEETALWLKLASVGAVGVAQNEEAVACVRRHGRHSRDASDPLAELGTFLHVLLDVLDWTSKRHDVSEVARDVLGEKLRTYCIEILSDGALPMSFKAQAWLRSVLARPRLALNRQCAGNLARALLRWPPTGSR